MVVLKVLSVWGGGVGQAGVGLGEPVLGLEWGLGWRWG